MGCVRREAELGGAPPQSRKKCLRFRRKRKGKKSKRKELEQEGHGKGRDNGPDEREEGEEEEDDKVTVTEMADSFSAASDIGASPSLLAFSGTQLARSKRPLPSNTFTPGSVSTSAGGLVGSRVLELTPNPSPAWRGVFCLPGEEGTVSASVDVSSIPSQTTTTTTSPASTTPALGSTTPGGGRVFRVKEKVQGVLEKPWIIRPKKEKKERVKVEEEKREDEEGKGGIAGTVGVVRTPSGREHKGVVHIREVDGKLCVVRTIYPSDYGSPVWRGGTDGEVEVRAEPPGPSPVTSKILKVRLSEEDSRRAKMAAAGPSVSSKPMGNEEIVVGKEFSLDTPRRRQEGPSLLESGYASDLPLASPETGGATPSQTDWGGLTSSSSERLDSMMDSPLTPQQLAPVKQLPQV